MENHYTALVSETNEKIMDIRRSAQTQITEAQNLALTKVRQDFIALGWDKFWIIKQLFAEGQFEHFEHSVIDTDLKLVWVDQINKKGVVEDRVASCEVSGQKCTCADFVFRGLPCRHIYYLAGVLIDLLASETEEVKT